jgi:hypothetical protein
MVDADLVGRKLTVAQARLAEAEADHQRLFREMAQGAQDLRRFLSAVADAAGL